MKHPFKSLILTIILIFSSIGLTQANSLWSIKSFNTLLNVQSDSSIIVTETIKADFTHSSSPRHGIIRNIPIHYVNQFNQNVNIRFSLISITNQNEQPLKYQTSYPGDYVSYKIGNANIYVSGIRTYIIKYKVQRGITSFNGYDEIYWNATGDQWDTDIQSATATVKLPQPNSSITMKGLCFTGYKYSKEHNCNTKIINNSTYFFQTNKPLTSAQGLTIVAKIDPNNITFPSILILILWFLEDNWGYLIPIFILLLMLWQWNKKGRDPHALKSTIMPEYKPPNNLSPAEIGTLIDDRVDNQDMTSSIIDLAVRGYLTIKEKDQKKVIWDTISYTLKTTNKTNIKDLKDFEQTIYNNIFKDRDEVDLDNLKYEFYQVIPTIKNQLYNGLTNQKYYVLNPDKIRKLYYSIGGIILFTTLFFLTPLITINFSLYAGILISSIIIIIIGHYMPAKTQKGADTLIHILGLEEFIKTADADRVKFYEKENIFEKILPYAIALGLGEKWSKTFQGILKETPAWYHSNNTIFNTVYFYSSLNSFNSHLTTSMYAAPRSAGSSGFGGGFSGGGFGGGGGSSW